MRLRQAYPLDLRCRAGQRQDRSAEATRCEVRGLWRTEPSQRQGSSGAPVRPSSHNQPTLTTGRARQQSLPPSSPLVPVPGVGTIEGLCLAFTTLTASSKPIPFLKETPGSASGVSLSRNADAADSLRTLV